MKSPAFQWYPKQWLGDNHVQGMDWDAQAMHFHLINLAWQEEPPGTIPADEPLIRRWLRLPSDHPVSDEVWRRVRPQIFGAWVRSADGTRWAQKGLVEAAERQNRYRRRYADAKCGENCVKNTRDSKKTVNSKDFVFPSLLEITAYCKERHNSVNAEQWLSHYQSNGWMVGRSRMKDWKAAVRTWEHSSYGETNGKQAKNEAKRYVEQKLRSFEENSLEFTESSPELLPKSETKPREH